jgi:hypothetical protein
MSDVKLTDMLPNEQCMVLDWVAVVKYLNEDSEIRLGEFTSVGVSMWEAVGMLTAMLDDFRHEMLGDSRHDDE